MTIVKPFIRCVDYWPCELSKDKINAYKQLIAENQIVKHAVIFNQVTKTTIVEYFSTIPHEWILNELKKRSNAL